MRGELPLIKNLLQPRAIIDGYTREEEREEKVRRVALNEMCLPGCVITIARVPGDLCSFFILPSSTGTGGINDSGVVARFRGRGNSQMAVHNGRLGSP